MGTLLPQCKQIINNFVSCYCQEHYQYCSLQETQKFHFQFNLNFFFQVNNRERKMRFESQTSSTTKLYHFSFFFFFFFFFWDNSIIYIYIYIIAKIKRKSNQISIGFSILHHVCGLYEYFHKLNQNKPLNMSLVHMIAISLLITEFKFLFIFENGKWRRM